MKKSYKFLVIIIILFLGAVFLAGHKLVLAPEILQEEMKTLTINGLDLLTKEGEFFKVEIADTQEEKTKGLSIRQFLPENQGMLFVFDVPDHYSFWMKDMNFSLDFIWIKGNEIIEITRNVKPEDYQPPKSLVSKNKIDKVLEVNSGVADKLGIKEGDKIEAIKQLSN